MMRFGAAPLRNLPSQRSFATSYGTDDVVGKTMTTTIIKTRVPSANRRAILSVIDNQMNSAKVEWQTKYLTNVETNSSKVDFIINECIDKTGLVLKRQVEEMTTTEDDNNNNLSAEDGDDEAMTPSTRLDRGDMTYDPLDSFKMRQLQLTTIRYDINRDEDDDDVSHSSSSIDDITEAISFDEEELFDQDAYNQVKQLRSKARDISSNVIALREETTSRALDVVKRDLSVLLSVHGFSSIQDDTDDNNNNNNDGKVVVDHETTKEGKNDEEIKSNIDSLHPMNVAIQTLIGSIQTIDTDLSTKLEELKETIGTIDNSVNKWVDGSTLSQTEKAIIASTYAQYGEETDDLLSRREHRGGGGGEENDESPMNPEKKLARLLAGIL